MLYFPQLQTGAVAQYPLRRGTVTRTVVNVLPDGSSVRLTDPDAAENRWELRYTGLSDAERAALEDFFRQAEGPLREFLFLDPEGNLLRWSEDLTKSVWQAGGLLSLTRAEGAWRIENRGQTGQGITQAIEAPGWFRYCFSATVRSAVPTPVTLTLSNSDGEVVTGWKIATEWQRVWCSGSVAGENDEIRSRIEFAPGASVHVRSLQMQAQPMPGSYRHTESRGGAYVARFAQDEIEFRANGVDDHSTNIRIVSRPGA